MVSIWCITYNHEPYIRQCLDGFVMQKANFRFKAIVHDDASTDGTAEIVREYAEKYPDIIKPILETENQYSKRDGSLERIMNEHTEGKYIAICEGDDYWIEPLKLQKQIQFLENHPDYGLAYSLARFQKGNDIYGCHGTSDCSFEGLISYSNFPTLTRVYRRSIYDQYFSEIKPGSHNWLTWDYPMAFYFVLNSKIKFFNEFFAVYRLLEASASHSKNKEYLFEFYDSADDVRYFFINQNNNINESQKEYLRRLVVKRNVEYKLSYCINNNLKSEAILLYRKNSQKLSFFDRIKWWIFVHSRFTYYTYATIMRSVVKFCKIAYF